MPCDILWAVLSSQLKLSLTEIARDSPGGPVVKTLPSNAGGEGLIPGLSHMPPGQKNQNIKEKQYCNKFNKDFKNGLH